MANRQKGEIAMSIAGQEYVLFFGTNAMELVEEHFSTPEKDAKWQEVLLKATSGQSIRYMRAMIWASLQKFHKGFTLEQTGDLIDTAGGIESFATQMSAAAGIALPTQDDLKALGLNGRPQSAQKVRRRRVKSTGTPSSATHDASV
jgi:hypothetical protein